MVAGSEGLKTPALPKMHPHTHGLGLLSLYPVSVPPNLKPQGTQVFVLGRSPVPQETLAAISRYKEKERGAKRPLNVLHELSCFYS